MAHNQRIEANECQFCNGNQNLELNKVLDWQYWIYKIGLFRTDFKSKLKLSFFRKFKKTQVIECPLCEGKGQIERTVDYDDGRED